ncbi:MAG: stage II sporulation protein M [Bacteroidota bacterium]
MREAIFVRRHAEDWRAFEQQISSDARPDPDALAEGYVRMGDDLAYAKTFYPGSPTAAYLNDLSAEVHRQVYRNRREERGRFVRFWRTEVPLAMYEARRAMVAALLLFVGAIGVGWISASGDADFARLIMGDLYIEMTEANIERGDPFAVFKDMRQDDMAVRIIQNNVLVSFLAFIGVLIAGSATPIPGASLATGWILVRNGIMVGAIAHFFTANGYGVEFLRVVMIHGTPELAAIAIAGGAGLTMWNAFLFPGTYPRRVAFMRGAKRGLKIIVALVPVFIIAGLLEGFVTRLTEMPPALSWTIIATSAAGMVAYFVWLPWRVGTEAGDASVPS